MPTEEDLGTITYNGISLGYVKTVECDQSPEFEESGSDQLYLTTKLRFNSVLSQKVMPVKSGETVPEAALRITHMLTAPRRSLRYARGETVLIDLPDGRDSANGPIPFGVSVRDFTEASWLITWGVEVRQGECPDGKPLPDYKVKPAGRAPAGATPYESLINSQAGGSGKSGAGAYVNLPWNPAASADLVFQASQGAVPRRAAEDRTKTRPAYNGILSNRWAESHDINPDDWRSTITRRGTLVVDPSAGIHPDLFRGLVTPPAPPGFRREAHYDVTKDGLKLNYSFTDRQLVKPPPTPATKMTGYQLDNSQEPGVVRRGVLSITLQGPPGTHPAYLADACIRIGVGRALSQGLRPFGDPAAWIIGGGFRDSLDDDRNAVTLDISYAIQAPAKMPRPQGKAGNPLGPNGAAPVAPAANAGFGAGREVGQAAAGFLDVVGQALGIVDPAIQQAARPILQGAQGIIQGAAVALDANGVPGVVADFLAPRGAVIRRGPAGPNANATAAAPIGAWIGSPLDGTTPGRVVAPPTRAAAGWLTLVAAALKDPCLEMAVKKELAPSEVPAVAAATVRVVAELSTGWVETLYADNQQGAYTHFICRVTYAHASGLMVMEGAGPLDPKTGRPYPHPVTQPKNPSLGVTLELTASKVGGEPDLPDFVGDDNLKYIDAKITMGVPDLCGDGSTAEYGYAVVAYYKARVPSDVFVKPPIPPFLKPYAKYLFGRSLALGRTSPGWLNYPEGGAANPFYTPPQPTTGSQNPPLPGATVPLPPPPPSMFNGGLTNGGLPIPPYNPNPPGG
ncbi:hypothetical protein [Limnoglobus roseus]|uniref:Uncharacterized protein n=1 Tax=Limnoglobus roseus TaxID=2598579 RepID=A0A5C1AL14_9BACT|nr:hypothetical protein [Limnoglobus roseus]QEL18877.1 hypothetical protein PX52LOC_05919 [Limnoglobus roseus]